MKEYRVNPGKDGKLSGRLEQVERPSPKDDQVLIKVHVTGTNPKDWKYGHGEDGANTGDDIAGIIESTGSKVLDFKPGDRVAAFHVMGTAHGSYAEYAIAPASTTFHIPPTLSFEDAATIPLVAFTASIGLYQDLGLPTPWSRPLDPSADFERRNPIPLVVYGGTTAVGLTALKFARLSGIYPIITVAGASKGLIESANLADTIIDYRGNKDVAGDIARALGGRELLHAFDAFSEAPSAAPLAENLSPSGKLVGVLYYEGPLANGHTVKFAACGNSHPGWAEVPSLRYESLFDAEFAYVFSRYLTRLLVEGKFETHPVEVLPGGLNGIAEGLNRLKEGKVKGSKLVARIAETEGL
ncbi:hypothetical protein DRE_00250 [Drechslerella stenobrocha 248]|uniref:Enoyl reductase (ER) domain-containing protein n=1 Tax=Drechslerella stenobrocha 248 TaxID=1043628 RepID=W7II14_9PEZI|nr:hypothetical protein DRE_00250 [Drechslerella stenobrocha 248]